MLSRFYCPHLPATGMVTLHETESHHLSHVLRQKVGDLVELFSGQGLVANCRITAIHKRDVELEVLASRSDPASQNRLIIATAVPKGDRFDWLIEKATELGVRRVIPLVTLRSVVDPRSGKLDKLRQTVISACKQCGRNHLMEISPVTAWSDFVSEYGPGYMLIIADPAGQSLDSAISSEWKSASGPMVITIGPEGGFSDEEVAAAIRQGAHLVQLGRSILRIETAAIALASRLLF